MHYKIKINYKYIKYFINNLVKKFQKRFNELFKKS